jgi:CCR4-NOT transcriptional complex subunit CAF120
MERQQSVTPSPLRQSTMAQPSSPSHARSPSFFSFRKSHSHSNSDSQLHHSPSMSPPSNGNVQSLPSLSPTQQPQDPTSNPPSRQPSTSASQLHPEIRSLVQLNVGHAYKIYYSGPLVRRVDRLPDGQKATKDEGWTDVWAQLGGTTLSIWDMKQVQEASKQGREVPPTYINMTDAVCISILSPH